MVVSNNHITIDIRPAVGIYATYRRRSYKPWYLVCISLKKGKSYVTIALD